VSETTATIPTSTSSTVFSHVLKATATSSRSARIRVRVRANTFDTAILPKVISCSLLATFNAFPVALEGVFSMPKQKQWATTDEDKAKASASKQKKDAEKAIARC
jgi:hypothetical protein